jgi:hypothetical protein
MMIKCTHILPIATLLFLSMLLASPLSLSIIPSTDEPLLSSWPPTLEFVVGRPAVPIDPKILAGLKTVGHVSFGANPGGLHKNQVLANPLEAEDGMPLASYSGSRPKSAYSIVCIGLLHCILTSDL